MKIKTFITLDEMLDKTGDFGWMKNVFLATYL